MIHALKPMTVMTALAVICGCAGDEEKDEEVSDAMVGAINATGWGENVAISVDDGTFTYTSNGFPNHALNAEYVMPDDFSPCVPHPTPECTHVEPVSTAVSATPINLTITTTPELVDNTVSSPFGSMGVMISGVAVYNPFEGDGTTVAMNANFTIKNDQGQDVAFMDACHGHPSPHPAEAYHYHGRPPCVTEQVDEEGGPSHIIGFAFDGFPIYGDRDINGDVIDPSVLDECNGLDSPTPEFPDGVYHYVLLEVHTEQSTIRCLHGKLELPLLTYQYL